MNDDQLANELRRRAGRADVPDLLPAVRSAIDTRPQRVPASRWAPLAGLAAAAAIVMILIVALPRLAPDAQPTGGAAASSQPPPTPAPLATTRLARLHDCGSVWKVTYGPSPVFVVDDTGTVLSCTAEQWLAQWPAGAADLIVQTVGDAADEIEVAWRRTELCSPERILVELSSTSAGVAIRLILDRSGPYGYECVGGPGTAEHAVLALAAPIDPARVTVELVTVPDPDVPIRLRSRTFDCAPAEPVADGSLAPGGVPQIVDHTGEVTSCRQVEAGAPVPAGVAVTNLNGFDSVRFDWVDTTCDGPVEADFRGAVGGYRLAVKQPLETCAPGVQVAVVVDYLIPMPSALVTADLEQPPPVVACADTPGVTVVDEVGVVRSCDASVSTASPGSDVVFDNPGGDTSALQISWAGGSQCTYEVHLQPGDGYAIQIYNMSMTCPVTDVVHTVTLHLTTPIGVNEIMGWSIGGPPRSPQPGPSLSPSQPPPSSTPDPPPTTTAINCSGAPASPESGSVSIADHTGLIAECSVSDGPTPDGPGLRSSDNPPRLIVEWTAYCGGSLPAHLQFWRQERTGEASTRPPFLLSLDTAAIHVNSSPSLPVVCTDMGVERTVEIALSEPIDATQVEFLVASQGRASDAYERVGAGPGLMLSISATKSEYAQGEAIDVSSALVADADVTVACLRHPTIALEQLDGDIRFSPGPFTLACVPATDLRAGEPLTSSFLPAVWALADPHPLGPYLRDDKLYLPAGTYRFFATSSFGGVGEGIADSRVELEVSVIVTVR